MRPLALVALLLAGCSPEADLTVFASASATDAATDLAAISTERDGVSVVVSSGATSTLARQVDAGAPADVVLLVGDEWPQWLESRQRLDREPVEVAFGRLAVIIPAGGRPWASIEPLAQMERVALGDPEHVPAGRFARGAMERAGLWRAVGPRVIPFPDVRGAVGAVASGRADAAVVYETDVWTSDRVRLAALWPDSLSATIPYRCGVVAGSARADAARRFCQLAATSVDVWEQLGFRAAALSP